MDFNTPNTQYNTPCKMNFNTPISQYNTHCKMKKTVLINFLILILCSSASANGFKNRVKAVLTTIENKGVLHPITANLKKEIPILCYHNIRDFKPNDTEFAKTYTVTPAAFANQMQALSKEGYHTISPDQLYNYEVNNKPLPPKPIMITFDDTHEEHYKIAAVEMEKYNFKGVFFIMTVSINRPNYMSSQQIKDLSNRGHSIGAHTWDHHRLTKYTPTDWDLQLSKPKKRLEEITGKSINYFAYPYGLWDKKSITELKKRAYKMAFILSTKKDPQEPNFTIRRIIVSGYWSVPRLINAINSSFNKT